MNRKRRFRIRRLFQFGQSQGPTTSLPIAKGGIDNVLVDHRLIFQRALALNATKIILAHNHPSQQLKASQADIKLTQRVKNSGELLNIKLIDHIIIAGEDYLSIG